MKIAVLGAGAWGTAIAISLSRRHSVALWARSPQQCSAMRLERSNKRYLPDHAFPRELEITDDITSAVDGAHLTLVAVATAGLRETLQHLKTIGSASRIVWLCKGFERGSGKLPHQVYSDALGSDDQCGALSGPSFAEEVARGLPSAVTLASSSPTFAREAAVALHSAALRVYSGDDLVGVEVAGAVKNVMAIAAGICDGLGYGHNARAALITRGLAEITRLGVVLGGRAETFMGLAGAGDLILTCTGDLSRNRRVGLRLARAESLSSILADLGHVAEGVHTAYELDALANRLAVEMPITRAVVRVMQDHTQARAAADDLLQRDPKPERGAN